MAGTGERFGLGVSNCRPVGQVLAALTEAEALGAELAFVAEDINCRDAFELCALGGVKTERIRLGPGVANPYTRNPTSLAMAAATLDEISAGRAMLGLGTSSPSLIAHEMGIARGEPPVVMEEAMRIVRALLRGERVTFTGKRFTYRDAALEVRPVQGHLPIYLAAMGPSMLRLAGRLADGVLLNVGASVEFVRWAVGQIRAGEAEAGRPEGSVTIAAWMSVYIRDDRDAAVQRAREWLATMLSIPRQGELLLEHSGIDTAMLAPIRALVSAYPHGGDPEAAARYVPAEVAERLTLIGDAREVRTRLAQYRAAGVDVPVLSIGALRALR